MKLFLIIATIAILGLPNFTKAQAINNALRRQIEAFRKQMPCGFGETIQPLAPLRHDLFEFDMDWDGFRNHGYLRNILIENLDKFILNDINFNILQLRIDYSFLFQYTPGSGQYYFDATVAEWIRLWGNGNFAVKAIDFDVTGLLRLTVRGGFLDMSEFNATVSLRKIESNIDGIFGGGGVSDFYNRVLEEFIPEFINQYNVEIGHIISGIVTPPINGVLNEMTLSDLLDAINDESEPSEPCIPPT